MNNKLVRNEVFRLRKKGKSYREISEELSIPKSTLSGWLKDEVWSEDIRINLTRQNSINQGKKLQAMAEANRTRFNQFRQSARDKAHENFPLLIKGENRDLFIAGLMIYAGEGDSKVKNSIVRIANTDPRMIKIFIKFLIKICNVESHKIRIALVIYPDISQSESKSYWSMVTGLGERQFHKTQVIKGKHPSNRLKNGICYVIVCSRELKEKVLVWIDLCYKSL